MRAWAPTVTRRRIRCSPNCGQGAGASRLAGDGDPREPRGGPQIFSAYTFDAVKAVFTDNKTFSTRCYEAIVRPLQGPTILEMQEPEHRCTAGCTNSPSPVRRCGDGRPNSSVRWWSAPSTGCATAKRADLVEEVFMPIPVRVIAALIGLPESDIRNSTAGDTNCSGFHADMDTALKASAQLKEYFVGILADRRRDPRDDMVTVLAEADIDGVRMSDEQIYGFMRNLLPAGAETTSRSTASSGLGAVDAPRSARGGGRRSEPAAAGDRGRIRWETPLLNFMRETTRDVEFHGVAIPEGSTVSVNLGSANHDEARWDDPERFDIFRERKPHIGFGHGAHVCIGMHLARLESTLIFNTLFDRLPGLRLDPDAPPPYVAGMLLPVPAASQGGVGLRQLRS